jgi:hypothetical protein
MRVEHPRFVSAISYRTTCNHSVVVNKSLQRSTSRDLQFMPTSTWSGTLIATCGAWGYCSGACSCRQAAGVAAVPLFHTPGVGIVCVQIVPCHYHIKQQALDKYLTMKAVL